MRYDALIGFWNGACYETVERTSLDATEQADAIAEAEKIAGNFDASGDYDMQIVVEDEDGDEVWSATYENSVSLNREEEMTLLVESEGDFETVRIMTDGEKFFRVERNGGSRGAHDRTDGSGRWIENYTDPIELTAAETVDWLVEGDSDFSGMSTTEAVDLMAEKSDLGKADIVRDAGDCIATIDSLEGLYKVRSKYFLTWPDAQGITSDEAQEWLDEHDLSVSL